MDRRVKHGMGGRSGRPPEYLVWCKMRQRCDSTTDKNYPNYGGRGIKVCQPWYDFAAFYADMGPRPTPAHTIERVDNDRGYEPGNCVWATRSVQIKNRRPRKAATHCLKGHLLDAANTYHRPDGKRGCKECRRTNLRALRASKRIDAHV